MSQYTPAELQDIINKHGLWLGGNAGGQRADLRGADLWGAALRGAALRGADLRGAYLRGAYLQGAGLWGADLQRAYLWGADLRGAYLRGADLRGADLRGADGETVTITDGVLSSIRGHKISAAQLTEWGACSSGMKWVAAVIGAEVSCADLYAHGKDDYCGWLFSRVLTLLYPPARNIAKEAGNE